MRVLGLDDSKLLYFYGTMTPNNKQSNLHLGASGHLFGKARELRQTMTDAETQLWPYLRNRRLMNTKFRRQHPLLNYIVDFYCHEFKLAVELDGEIHDKAEQKKYDEDRTRLLEENGIKVIRFSNDEVLGDVEKVLEVIRKHLS